MLASKRGVRVQEVTVDAHLTAGAPIKLSDEALVQACRSGDEAAWEAVVDRYQRLVFAIAREAKLDQEQAADVFQLVFIKLFRWLDRIEQPSRLGAWLATTARREAWLVKRREHFLWRNNTVHIELEYIPGDEAQLPEERMLRLEQQHAVYMAMQALDPRCRDLLVLLFYHNELPAYTDIAARLGMNQNSISPTRARCLKKLQQLLDQQYGDQP